MLPIPISKHPSYFLQYCLCLYSETSSLTSFYHLSKCRRYIFRDLLYYLTLARNLGCFGLRFMSFFGMMPLLLSCYSCFSCLRRWITFSCLIFVNLRLSYGGVYLRIVLMMRFGGIALLHLSCFSLMFL